MSSTPDLLSTADIARMFGLTREYITDKLTKKPDFPKPRVRVSQKTTLWARADIEQWASPTKSPNAS